jgi:excisionase family DNA binding protein
MEPLLCTIAETAALLRVSVYTVRRSIAAGIIPAKRIRRSVRISRAWLDSYVAETQPILLTRRQVSRKLGIGATALRTLLRKGALPLVRIGRLERIPVAAVNEYINRNRFAFLRSGGRTGSEPPRSVSPSPREVHPASAHLLTVRVGAGLAVYREFELLSG